MASAYPTPPKVRPYNLLLLRVNSSVDMQNFVQAQIRNESSTSLGRVTTAYYSPFLIFCYLS